jgi:succinate dehydrogenase / fumarate reductase cytochrome b subunit
MLSWKRVLTSSVGKKIFNGLSALGAVVFVFAHLGGNLTLLGGAEAFNDYAAKLHALGPLLYVLEFGLIGVFLLHIVTSISVTLESSDTRGEGYEANQTSKGGPSNYGLASTKMIVSGLFLLVFTVVHLAQFRLRHWWSDTIGQGAWDIAINGSNYYKHLYAMVDWTFAPENPLGLFWVVFYCGVMVFLGLHARHGIWSMLQTIGAMNKRWKSGLYSVAFVLGVALAVGFFWLPIHMYFFSAPPAG